jgi:transcriptional regulator with XRE-family HTH domain
MGNYLRDRIPKTEELHRLAKFFGVSMDYLFTGTGTESAEALHECAKPVEHTHRVRCAEHLQQWLDRWEPDQLEWHGWTLVELRKRFPLAAQAVEAISSGKGSDDVAIALGEAIRRYVDREGSRERSRRKGETGTRPV